jgi:5-methylcytosine-specific restriction endonuclease McrA
MIVYGFWFYEELANKVGVRPGLHHYDQGDREDSYIWLDTPNGQSYEVKDSSNRLELFRQNPKCVKCHRVGQLWLLESHRPNERPHLNLYYAGPEEVGEWKKLCDNGLILMTKDHIIPKSKGGPTNLDNLQTMCSICNGKKGSTMPKKLGPVQQAILDNLGPKSEMQSLGGMPHFI